MIRKTNLFDVFKIYRYYKENYQEMEMFKLFIPYYLLHIIDIYACFNQGKIIGIVYLVKKGKSKNQVYNLGLFVTKEYRGKRIGTKLMKKAFENNYKKVTLGVKEDNIPARKIYKKFGFKPKSKKILMEKNLDKKDIKKVFSRKEK